MTCRGGRLDSTAAPQVTTEPPGKRVDRSCGRELQDLVADKQTVGVLRDCGDRGARKSAAGSGQLELYARLIPEQDWRGNGAVSAAGQQRSNRLITPRCGVA